MRGTLHLLAADDLPLHAAARTIDPRGWIEFESHGISEDQAQVFMEAVPEVLGSEPMTRQQPATAVAERVGLPALGELIASSGWGMPLKLLPLFDAYVLDIGRIGEPILPEQHRKQVFRQGGWTTAVVLVDGFIKDIWDYKTKETQTTISVEMFDRPAKLLEP